MREREQSRAPHLSGPEISRLNRYTGLLAVLWTVVVFASLSWNLVQVQHNTEEAGRIQAREIFQMDVLYRRWNARCGGLYAPLSDEIPPNPYLDVAERDLQTPSGRWLTLVNPAYMTRLVHELGAMANGIQGHITSLNPIRPENAPDPWEAEALRAFEDGETEKSGPEVIDGNPYMRLMRPLSTEGACLKCHAVQGYQEGDIRGGIRVSVPISSLQAMAREQGIVMTWGHAALGLLGLAGLGLGRRRVAQGIRQRLQTEVTVRESEQALAVERNRLRALVDNLPDVIYVKDAENRFVVANAAMARLTGVDTPDELLGKTDFDVYPRELAEQYGAEEREIMRTGQAVIDQEEPLVDPEGRRRWFSTTKVPLRDSRGQITGVVGMGRDLTDRKRMQEELIRTQRLRAVGEVAAGVSHNLNNMLSIVLGPAQLLLRISDDPDVRREAEEIIASGRRARDLVQRLNQAVCFKVEATLYAVSVNEVVEQAVQTTRPRWQDEARAQGLAIEVLTQLAEMPDIRGTSTELHEVLLNLLLNAVDAMPGGGAITIRTQVVDGGVQLRVSDTGVGMDEETRRRVFEPLFTTRMDVGSGLGLATVHGIVQRWGGRIEVESAPGEGTTFTLWLPAWTEPERQEADSTAGGTPLPTASGLVGRE